GCGDLPDVSGIRKEGVRDVQLALSKPIDPETLLVDVRIEPVVEHTEAPPQRGLAVLERRPGDADPRPEGVVVVQVRLHLVSQAWTQRQTLAHADIVLDVQPRHDVLVIDVWIADAPGEASRRTRREGLRT